MFECEETRKSSKETNPEYSRNRIYHPLQIGIAITPFLSYISIQLIV